MLNGLSRGNFRSRKLLDAAKDAPVCFCCGKQNDGTVVMAHANWHEYGKGKGIKAHDWAVAAICYECHSQLDQGNTMSNEDKKHVWIRAHILTLAWLFDSGKIKIV